MAEAVSLHLFPHTLLVTDWLVGATAQDQQDDADFKPIKATTTTGRDRFYRAQKEFAKLQPGNKSMQDPHSTLSLTYLTGHTEDDSQPRLFTFRDDRFAVPVTAALLGEGHYLT